MTVSNNRPSLKAMSFLIVTLTMILAPHPGAEATVVCDLRMGGNNGSDPLEGSPAEALVSADESGTRPPPDVAGLTRQQFQRRLIAALITVASVIMVLLLILMRMCNSRPHREPSWKSHLPPAKDMEIEHIDAVIRDHLKRHEHG